MPKYHVYARASGGAAEAVKDGFCWPGFFVPPLWLISHRLWIWTCFWIFAVVGAAIVIALLPDPQTIRVVATASALVAMAPGAMGNLWREDALVARGYVLVARVKADDPHEAIMAWRAKTRRMPATSPTITKDLAATRHRQILQERRMMREHRNARWSGSYDATLAGTVNIAIQPPASTR